MSKKHKQTDASLEAALGLEELETLPVVETPAEVIPEVKEEIVEEVVQETVETVVNDEGQGELFPEIVEKKTNPSGLVLKDADEDGLVKDAAGNVLYKRKLKAVVETEAPVRKRLRVDYKKVERRKDISGGLYANASLLTFPTDRWGITKDLKKAITVAASRIAGDAGKKNLFDETLDILIKHVNEKYEADAAYKQSLSEKAE